MLQLLGGLMTGTIKAGADLVVEYRIWSEKQAPAFPFVTVISPVY